MENPFKQKPFEVDPAVLGDNKYGHIADAVSEELDNEAPLQQIDPREYYADSPEVLPEVEEGLAELDKHPEAKELAFKLSNPHIERDEFMRMVDEWNDAMNAGGQPAEGMYNTARFPFDRIDRTMVVKMFENGRVTFSAGGIE